MQRSKRPTIQRLLGAIHSTKVPREFAPAWRNSVMAEIARTGQSYGMATEFERLAPRIAFVAATLSVIALTSGTWMLHSLPGELYAAYANDYFTFNSTLMSL